MKAQRDGICRWLPKLFPALSTFPSSYLFLFFLGLGDSPLAVHTTVGVITVVPIAICDLIYICSMFAPVMSPRSPFQNPFSTLIWVLTQKVYPRSYDTASGGTLKPLSQNISEGKI